MANKNNQPPKPLNEGQTRGNTKGANNINKPTVDISNTAAPPAPKPKPKSSN